MGLVSQSIALTGIARTGVARLNSGQVVYEAEGGPIFGGDAQYTVDPYIVIASGGADTGGTDPGKADYNGDSSGGLLADGTAPFSIDFSAIATGGADTAGDAPHSADYIDNQAGGGATAAGEAVALAEYIAEGSGQADLGGTAPAYPEMFGNAGGSVVTGGTAVNIYADYFDIAGGQGGAIFGGVATVIFTIDVKGLPVFIRRFDGDIRLSLSQDGGIIKIRGGQPDMDDGLTTAVNISLFSQGDWWGNALADDGEEVGSTFLDSLAAPLTNQARLDVIESAKRALAWMTDTGIAGSVDVQATIPAIGRLDLSITIRQPERAPTVFRYTVNWQNQRVILQEAAA
jgi:phage gp46-like protein